MTNSFSNAFEQCRQCSSHTTLCDAIKQFAQVHFQYNTTILLIFIYLSISIIHSPMHMFENSLYNAITYSTHINLTCDTNITSINRTYTDLHYLSVFISNVHFIESFYTNIHNPYPLYTTY